YPFRVLMPAVDYKGMAVFSKLPIISRETLFYAPESSPILKVTFTDPSLTIFNVHTLSPVTEQWAMERDGMLAWLAPQARSISGPVIVAGDFNMTNTNPLFRDFLSQADLEDARAGNGWRPSWERGRLMIAAIDQLLYRGAVAKGFRVLDAIGSDHRPIMSRFTISKNIANE
ncbi:MAG: endonuclease/exonuclease/phosphatase family protein, partial [Candidatus Komeilibacteria bacterium]|nr:endonuclease/exonuclease/phosphatase family protein [Candidatus Komeilibacteria bacterium]